MDEQSKLSRHQAIVDAFFKDLLSSGPHMKEIFEEPYVAFPWPIFGINTRPGYIFDDTFWDVFHVHPLHVCHVTRLTDGLQFDEGRVFEIRFKVDERRVSVSKREG